MPSMKETTRLCPCKTSGPSGAFFLPSASAPSATNEAAQASGETKAYGSVTAPGSAIAPAKPSLMAAAATLASADKAEPKPQAPADTINSRGFWDDPPATANQATPPQVAALRARQALAAATDPQPTASITEAFKKALSYAPAATSPAAGGYLVQVSSQKNEADVQASYRALQNKFPAALGSRPPVIKRADLGDKGVYYRTMVGPFGTPEEASQFCGSLKTAGGQCVVQRN